MFRNKRVLVTGGAGFIGTNLIKQLVSMGAEVRATLHDKESQFNDPSVSYYPYCDLTKPKDCQIVCRDIDYVFLCAANTSGAAVMEKTPLAHLTPNLMMNALMLEAAYAEGVKKVLFISTNTVYPLTNYPVVEEDANFDFYEKYFIVGWMKRFSEIMCEMYSTKIRKPMETVVVRPANIYGPYDDFEWETSHVLPAMIRRVVERHDPIEVWGDGKDIKDFIYIDDFVDGMLLAMEKISGFDVVNIASGMPYCLRDMLEIILELDGYSDADIRYDSTKPTMIPKRLINADKARRLLGFEASTPIEVGLKKTIEWYRENRDV
jgi:GDP-L-fucose synthase